MKEGERKIVAIDGLSLSGKSTMVGMISERALNAEVIRENTFDPHRDTTSYVNRELRSGRLESAVESAARKFPTSETLLGKALLYSRDYSVDAQKQALLAYLFTAGRKVVNGHVRETVKEKDVLLDRWQVTGWAYQADPVNYTWQEIRKLNIDFGIIDPHVQIILTCSIDSIPQRRAYREKEGVGTSGQMSTGREHIILPTFVEIYNYLKEVMPVEMIENAGIPTPNLVDQIKQAIQAYGKVEALLRRSGFGIKPDSVGDSDLFWLDPQRLNRIHERQTGRSI